MENELNTDAPSVPTAELRSLLERTGHLHTQHPEDVGHISERWRKEIGALLDAIDSGAQIGGDPSTPEDEVATLLAAVRGVLTGDIEAKFARAVFLIEEAVPVMQALNNARSSRWLPVAEVFLADGSVVRF